MSMGLWNILRLYPANSTIALMSSHPALSTSGSKLHKKPLRIGCRRDGEGRKICLCHLLSTALLAFALDLTDHRSTLLPSKCWQRRLPRPSSRQPRCHQQNAAQHGPGPEQWSVFFSFFVLVCSRRLICSPSDTAPFVDIVQFSR